MKDKSKIDFFMIGKGIDDTFKMYKIQNLTFFRCQNQDLIISCSLLHRSFCLRSNKISHDGQWSIAAHDWSKHENTSSLIFFPQLLTTFVFERTIKSNFHDRITTGLFRRSAGSRKIGLLKVILR